MPKPSQNVLLCLDDVSADSLQYFEHCDRAREASPNLRVIAFTIARGIDADAFGKWLGERKEWVEVGVHGYDHDWPPEQERDNARELVEKSLEILRPFLPERFLYRPPGWQRTIHTEPMLKDLGFAGIAYRTRIKYFDGTYITGFINAHCGPKYENPITAWKNIL